MPQQRARQKTSLLYDDGLISIQHGTATQLALPDSSVACVVTSPPYNVGLEYDKTDDLLTWAKYRKLAQGTCAEMFRVMMPGARIWINVVPFVPKVPTDRTTPKTKKRVHLAGIWEQALLDAGFEMWDTVTWISQRGNGTAWGSWESPANPNLRGDHEVILVGYKSHWYRNAPQGFSGWRDRIGGWPELCSNVWRIKPAQRTDDHPAPFPAEIARRAIRLSTWPGELVVDPFCGTGASLVAAHELGRRAHGVDLSKKYCLLTANNFMPKAPEIGT
jgi:DNA modification methylase